MNRNQYFSETVNSSITIEKNGESDFSTNKSNKLIISISCLIFATAPTSNIRAFEDESELNFHEYQKKTVMMESSTTVVSSQNFSSYNQKGDTLEMNNDKLEVDDLVERVTQAQVDEIKSHFDTKISSLEGRLSTQIESVALQTIVDLKKFIEEENNDIKKEKSGKLQFFIGSVIVPLVTVVLTLLGTKYFELF